MGNANLIAPILAFDYCFKIKKHRDGGKTRHYFEKHKDCGN
jgi:hypothetical protein